MAISMSSYEIIFPDPRQIVIVNAQPGEHVENRLIVSTSPTQAAMIEGYEDIETMLFDDGGPAYAVHLMELKKNNGGSVTGTPISLDGSNVLARETCLTITRYILEYEACRAVETMREEEPVKFGGNDDEEKDVCVICQEEFETGEKCVVLECEHGYHKKCIERWLRMKNDCPICRDEVLPFSSTICRFRAA